ncbi:MAG: trimethylamine methyltransferase family protein, partial [Desulfohalobiaceae bacterium]|nr:trimethylamine methyltransferase family protein [Desulfohalobiaceae bacterium]
MDLNLIAEGRRPSLSFLNTEDKEQIFAGALQVLADFGMQILQPEAGELLQRAGCAVEEDNMIKIPLDLV